jgi:hypothetical protein
MLNVGMLSVIMLNVVGSFQKVIKMPHDLTDYIIMCTAVFDNSDSLFSLCLIVLLHFCGNLTNRSCHVRLG